RADPASVVDTGVDKADLAVPLGRDRAIVGDLTAIKVDAGAVTSCADQASASVRDLIEIERDRAAVPGCDHARIVDGAVVDIDPRVPAGDHPAGRIGPIRRFVRDLAELKRYPAAVPRRDVAEIVDGDGIGGSSGDVDPRKNPVRDDRAAAFVAD